MKKKVVILGTGGTIAGRSESRSDGVGYIAGQLGISSLLKSIPALSLALDGAPFESEQVAQVDSKDMGIALWQRLHARTLFHLSRSEVGAVVITHGTDTLEETAYFLSATLPIDTSAAKVVVMTCAMRPATADLSDGPQNLCDAVAVAVDSSARGVLAVCAGTVHDARDVQKIHPYRLNAFASGEVGPLGFVEEGQVRWLRPPCIQLVEQSAVDNVAVPAGEWPRVEILMSMVGCGGAAIRSLCAPPVAPDSPVRGLVVAGTGNGTLSDEMKAAVDLARADGLKVVVTTRCISGQLVKARGASAPDSRFLGLSLVKVRIAVMLELLERRESLEKM